VHHRPWRPRHLPGGDTPRNNADPTQFQLPTGVFGTCIILLGPLCRRKCGGSTRANEDKDRGRNKLRDRGLQAQARQRHPSHDGRNQRNKVCGPAPSLFDTAPFGLRGGSKGRHARLLVVPMGPRSRVERTRRTASQQCRAWPRVIPCMECMDCLQT
jgi:hypothetical protein